MVGFRKIYEHINGDDFVWLDCDKKNLTRITAYLATHHREYFVYYQEGTFTVIVEATLNLTYMNNKLKDIEYTIQQ